MTIRRTNIGWADFSGGDLNFIIGCTPENEACANCYARDLIERRQGRDFSDIRLYPDKLNRLKRAKFEEKDTQFRRGPGSRPIAFVCDLSDFFHPQVPDDFRLDALRIMAFREDVDWVISTKRVTNLYRFCKQRSRWPPNVWLLLTVSTQAQADRMLPTFLNVKADVLGLSMEPLLESVDLNLGHLPCYVCGQSGIGMGGWECPACEGTGWMLSRLPDWVIVGAESGPHRRQFDISWATSIYDACRHENVPFFGKQNSDLYPGVPLLFDGREIKEFPR